MIAVAADQMGRAVGPRNSTHPIRGDAVTFVAMDDSARIEWWKMQAACAAQRVRAGQLAKKGDEEEFDKVLRLLVTADYSLCAKATGWPMERVCALTLEERAEIIAIQDGLNGTAQISPLAEPIARKAYLSVAL